MGARSWPVIMPTAARKAMGVALAIGLAAGDAAAFVGSASAVVTGSNKGIGFEICRQLLGAGFSVVVTGRNVQLGEEATSRLRREANGHLVAGFIQMDVADDDSVARSVIGTNYPHPAVLPVNVHAHTRRQHGIGYPVTAPWHPPTHAHT